MFMINPKENLIGKNFGRLTVKELSNNKTASRGRIWVCECECGNIKEISQNALITGATISCGCYNKERIRQQNFIDLTGKTFGRWKVIERAEAPKNIKNKNPYWLCECSCDKHTKKIVSGKSLRDGRSKSCGCLQREIVKEINFTNLTGKRFGNLTVMYQDEPPKTNKNKDATFWRCKCDCGNEVTVITANLNNGHTTSCGCINSKGELKIIKLLSDNNITFIHDKGVFQDCKLSTGGTARFDFYVNDSYVIEYDSEIHYKSSKNGWYTEERLNITKQRDREKNEYCWAHNIPIIRIPYWIYDTLSIDDLKLETSNYIVQYKINGGNE